jgi:hypothetical protein
LLLGGLGEPEHRLGLICRGPLAVQIHPADAVLAAPVAALRFRQQFGEGLRVVVGIEGIVARLFIGGGGARE